MTKKYTHRIDTMDGPIEYEDESPPSPIKTPEEMEEEEDSFLLSCICCSFCLSRQ
jgi:hypothetical protein